MLVNVHFILGFDHCGCLFRVEWTLQCHDQLSQENKTGEFIRLFLCSFKEYIRIFTTSTLTSKQVNKRSCIDTPGYQTMQVFKEDMLYFKHSIN